MAIERDDGEPRVVLDPPDLRWRGVSIEDGEETPIAVALVGGVLSPRVHAGGRWRDPASAFGYRIMSAWAESMERLAAAWEEVHRTIFAHSRRSKFGDASPEREALDEAFLRLVRVGGPDLRESPPPAWLCAADAGAGPLVKLGEWDGLVYFDGVVPEAYPSSAVAARESELGVWIEWRIGRAAQGGSFRPIVGHRPGGDGRVPVTVTVAAVRGDEARWSALRARRSR